MHPRKCELEVSESLSWSKHVDFVVLNGSRGGSKLDQLTTVVDLTSGDVPHIIRQGKGIFVEM